MNHGDISQALLSAENYVKTNTKLVGTVEKDLAFSTKDIHKSHKTQGKDVTNLAKRKITPVSSDNPKPRGKLTTEEGREKQLIAAAVNLAEKQLLDGTASAQVITHYLKLGTEKEKLELEIKKQEKELMAAKTEALKSAKRVEELYANALNAMRRYSGEIDDGEEDIPRINKVADF